jgi:hypothetical protein
MSPPIIDVEGTFFLWRGHFMTERSAQPPRRPAEAPSSTVIAALEPAIDQKKTEMKTDG